MTRITLGLPQLAALFLALIPLWFSAHFPIAALPLSLGLAGYILLLLRWPLLWLAALPALLPVLYLTAWSGRILWDSFDLLLLLSLASCWWHRNYLIAPPNLWLNNPQSRFLMLFSLMWLIAIFIGLYPLDDFDANAMANYHSSYNALRVGKSLIWALLFLPALHAIWATNAERARQYLYGGCALGLTGLAVFVLAERGVYRAMANAENIYGFFGPLLDFATTYRVTGLFADMHTGGAAIDAYLLLTLPLSGYAIFFASSKRLRWFCALACLLGLYCVLVTFSRATYAAVAVAFALLMLGLYARHAQGKVQKPWLYFGLGPLTTILACLLLFNRGGSIALIAGLGATAIGLLSAPVAQRLGAVVGWFLLGCAWLAGTLLSSYGMATSQWVENSLLLALLLGASTTSLVLFTAFFTGRQMNRILSLRQSFALTLIFCLASAIVLPSAFGTRMLERFSVLESDLSSRSNHAIKAFSLPGNSISNHLFGLGHGTFPVRFSQLSDTHAGSLAYLMEQDSQFLRIGGDSDFKVGQRFSYDTHDQQLTVRFDTRSDQQALVYAVIARKFLNNQLGHNPAWVSKPVHIVKSEEWQTATVTLDISKFAEGDWLNRPPLTLLFINPNQGTLVDIDNVSLTNPRGVDLLENGDFSGGGDRWYFYNDIKHLPWHTKNIWINLYVEMGLIGLLLFMLWAGSVLNATLRERRPALLSIPLTAAICGLLVVGISDGVFDVPRTTLLFFLLLLIAQTESCAPTKATENG